MKTPMDHDNKNAAYTLNLLRYGQPYPCLECDGTGVTFKPREKGADGCTIMCPACHGTKEA